MKSDLKMYTVALEPSYSTSTTQSTSPQLDVIKSCDPTIYLIIVDAYEKANSIYLKPRNILTFPKVFLSFKMSKLHQKNKISKENSPFQIEKKVWKSKLHFHICNPICIWVHQSFGQNKTYRNVIRLLGSTTLNGDTQWWTN